MIKLEIDQKFTLSPELFADVIDLSPDEFRHLGCSTYMAHEDGSASIYCNAHEKWDNSDSRDSKGFSLIALLQDSDITLHDVTPHIGVEYRNPGLSAFGFDNNIMFLSRVNRVYSFAQKGLGQPTIIKITNPIRDAKWIYAYSRVRCYGGIVAAPLFYVHQCNDVAFLMLQNDPPSAMWQKLPIHTVEKERKSNVINALFRKGERAARYFQPIHYEFVIDQAMTKNGRIFIFTRGMKESPKYGFELAAISEIGGDGELIEQLYFEDFRAFEDEKKRGRHGKFTSSGQYCVLSSYYKATDPWKGRQKLFDLDTKELIEFSLPRGYSRYRLADHHGSYFWFFLEETNGKSYKFIRCKEFTNK